MSKLKPAAILVFFAAGLSIVFLCIDVTFETNSGACTHRYTFLRLFMCVDVTFETILASCTHRYTFYTIHRNVYFCTRYGNHLFQNIVEVLRGFNISLLDQFSDLFFAQYSHSYHLSIFYNVFPRKGKNTLYFTLPHAGFLI